MRLVYFCVLSLALHAAALGYPGSFADPSKAEIIRITLAPTAQGIGDTMMQEGGGIPPQRTMTKAPVRSAPAVEPTVDRQSARESARQDLPVESMEKDNSNVAVIPVVASAEKNPNAKASSTSVSIYSDGSKSSGTDGFGSTGAGSGRGSGRGEGPDSSGNGIPLTQARYRDTPRPEYPETARREGREGRVLLRVLVDDQGRSEQVQINRSSGSEALDRAAVDAIKRWRFYPARHGDHSVESWIRVPIDFNLADNKPW